MRVPTSVRAIRYAPDPGTRRYASDSGTRPFDARPPKAVIMILLVIVPLVLVWGYQFIQLMLLSDSDFPGEYDKLAWALAFVFMFPIAPFAFMYWKQAYVLLCRMEAENDLEENT
jgi:hypothetical protein